MFLWGFLVELNTPKIGLLEHVYTYMILKDPKKCYQILGMVDGTVLQ